MPKKSADCEEVSQAENRPAGSSTRRALFIEDVIDKATVLFAEQGYDATSLQDIADAVGISRPTLYHYVRSKEDLLVSLVHASARFTEFLTSMRRREDMSASERLEAIVRAIVHQRTESPGRFKTLDRSEALLPPDVRADHRRIRRDLLSDLVAIMDDGIAADQFRPLDSRIAALSILGMCNWVAWWYQPDHGISAQAVVDQIADSVLDMIRKPDGNERGGSARGSIFDRLRSDVDDLERVFEARQRLSSP